jgi:hypothetical protein
MRKIDEKKLSSRRTALQKIGGIPLFSIGLLAPGLSGLFKSPIIPSLRRVDYEAARSPLVVWSNVNESSQEVKMNGFVEGVATKDLLPVIRPISVFAVEEPWSGLDRRLPDFPRSGLYLDFELIISFLGLPRRGRYNDGTPLDRHARSFLVDGGPNTREFGTFLEACATSLDHREITLVTEEGQFRPDTSVWHSSSHSKGFIGTTGLYTKDRSSEVGYLRPPVPTCSRKNYSFNAVIDFIIRFDTGHSIPERFELRLPPLLVKEKPIPLPVLYFEPYSKRTKEWVE